LVLRFVVKDYGKGIAKKDMKKIFEPCDQGPKGTERLYGETGLGLAITSKLVKSLSGTISVDSEVGEWTEFVVDLPYEAPAAGSKVASSAAASSEPSLDTTVIEVLPDRTPASHPSMPSPLPYISSPPQAKGCLYEKSKADVTSTFHPFDGVATSL
jgi:hypothetical protein